jgi:hypothetical protein
VVGADQLREAHLVESLPQLCGGPRDVEVADEGRVEDYVAHGLRSIFGGTLSMNTFGDVGAVDSAAAARLLGQALRERRGDDVLERQMWGDTFGMCTDRFGIAWLVNIAGGDARE